MAGRAGGPGRCSARCSSSARSPTAQHDAVGAEVVACGVDQLVVVGDAAARRSPTVPARAPAGRGCVIVARCRRGRGPAAGRAAAAATSSWSRRRRDAGLRLLGDRLAAPLEEQTMRAVLLAAVVSLVFSLLGTPTVHPVPGRARATASSSATTARPRTTPSAAPRRWAALVIIARPSLAAYVARARSSRARPRRPQRAARCSSSWSGWAWSASSTTTSRSASSAASGCAARRRWSARPSSPSPSRVLALPVPQRRAAAPRRRPPISFIRDTAARPRVRRRVVGLILFVLWANLIVAGTSQRGEPHRRARRAGHRRLGDGLRRLHAHRHLAVQPVLRSRARAPKCYEVRDPLDLAVVAAAMTGACFGFLWWNASPAKIFMGDTGSLALGGALAGLAILTRTELLARHPRRPVRDRSPSR